MSSAETKPSPSSDSRMIRRRSSASAIAPPHSPHTTIGPNSARLTSPTATYDPVSSFIWYGTATRVT